METIPRRPTKGDPAARLIKAAKDLGKRKQILQRLYMSGRDLNHASSALSFLKEEIRSGKTVDLEQARRVQSFETAFIVSYSRPFVRARGKVPPLSLKSLGIKLRGVSRQIHEAIIVARNKSIAHSDFDFVQVSPMTRSSMTRKDGSEYSLLFPGSFLEGTSVDESELFCLTLFLNDMSQVFFSAMQELHKDFVDEIGAYPLSPEEEWERAKAENQQIFSPDSD